MALVLVLDAILAGAGIVMILSYLDARKPPPPPVKPARAAAAAVEVGAPEPVADAPPSPARPPQAGQKQATGTRQQATGDKPTAAKQPAAAVPVVTPIAEKVAAEETPEETADDIDAISARLTEMVGRHSGDLEHCYQRVAKVAGPGDPLEGKIDIHVTVMPDGSARDVHAGENTTGSAQLADCVVSLFQSWTLPAGAAEPVELLWPLQFRAPAK